MMIDVLNQALRGRGENTVRQIFGCTDIGKQRAINQDAYRFDIGAYPWAVVCDGMGGPRAGDVASGIGVDVIARTIERGLRPDMTENSVRTLLVTALATANTSIHVRAGDDEACAGMGTTAVCALVREGLAHIAHVGDSRAYLVSRDGIEQVTRDHSLVQALVEQGQLTPEQAKVSPDKNMITRALGVEEEVAVDYGEVYLGPDDRLLLCTDGLTNLVPDQELRQIILSCDPAEAVERLVARANDYGGIDNITAVLIAAEE